MAVAGSGSAVDRRIRVFLLDDAEIVRRGVRELIDSEPDLEVVGEAATAVEALERAPGVHPDVALLDVRLPDGDGVTVCRELRSRIPGLSCLMLTSFSDDDALLDAILAGAAGYVLKQICGTDLTEAVRSVAAGQLLLDPHVTATAMAHLRAGSSRQSQVNELTAREHEILLLIGEGLTNRQIGERTHLTEKTVKNYVSNLLAKLGMARRTQAAVFAADVSRDSSGRLPLATNRPDAHPAGGPTG